MDRAMLKDQLEMARSHVALGEKHLARQRELILELYRDGHDTRQARELLKQFEELQALHVSDCKRLEQELNE